MSLKTFITMHRYTYALIIITTFILGGTIINNASAYTIDHNNHSVWVKGNYGKLEATPHTLSQSGWVYFNITPYQDIGNIDMVWGFNTSEVKPRKAEFYKPHLVYWTTHHEKFFRNVSKIELSTDDCCYGNSYNIYKRKVTYQTGYNNITNESITTTETVCFDSYTHNGSNYTAYWHTDYSRLENWIDVSNKFHSVNYDYDNKTKWWYVTNFAVEVNKTYTGRAWIDVPITLTGISGKYDFAVKRSSDSLHDAISNHRFYLLDPWFNSSWSTKRNLHIHYYPANNLIEDGYIWDNTVYTRYNTDNTVIAGCYELPNKICRGYIEWDISSIPDDAIITDVIFKYDGGVNDNDAHITQMVCRPSISSNKDVYGDIGNGTVYIDQDGFPVEGANQEINLGSDAVSDLQNALSEDCFSIGIQGDNETLEYSFARIRSDDDSSATPKPTLYVEYTSESETLNYYQMNLNLSYSDIPEAQPDFDDIRFVNISDGASLPYWIEDKVNGSWCNVWVNTTSLHAGWNNDTMALYYGNDDATSASNGYTTFEFFDDFEDGGYISNPTWTVGSGTFSVQDETLDSQTSKRLYSDSQGATITSTSTLVQNGCWEWDVYNQGRDSYGNSLQTGYNAFIYIDDNNRAYAGAYSGYMFRVCIGGTNVINYDSGSNTIATGIIHLKITRVGDTWTFYVDGVQKYQGTASGLTSSTYNKYTVSASGGHAENYPNRVDNFRFSKYPANPSIYILGNVESYTPSITPPIEPSFTEIDLIDQEHHEYTHIECKTMHIPIYTGLNYISIPLYQYNTSLEVLFGDHPVNNDTMKKYTNGNWYTSTFNNSTWMNASDIEPIEPTVGYEYNRTDDNFTLNVSGYMKYNITIYTNYKNRVGTNIIRPMRSDKDD